MTEIPNLIGDLSLTIAGPVENFINTGSLKITGEPLKKIRERYLKQARGHDLSRVMGHFVQMLESDLKAEISQHLSQNSVDFTGLNLVLSPNLDLMRSSQIEGEVTIYLNPDLSAFRLEELTIQEVECANITETDIDNEIDDLRIRYSSFTETDLPIEEGDYVSCKWHSQGDDGVWADDTQENLIHLGVSPRLEPDLEAKLIGAKKGDEVLHQITVPADIKSQITNPDLAHYRKDLAKHAGKSFQIKIEVLSVRHKTKADMPTLLERLNSKSETSLRELITKAIEINCDQLNSEYAKLQIINAMRSANVEIPQHEIDFQCESIWQNFTKAANVNAGPWKDHGDLGEVEQEALVEFANANNDLQHTTFQELCQDILENGQRLAKGNLILNSTLNKANIPENDLQNAVMQHINNLGQTVDLSKISQAEAQHLIRDARFNAIMNYIIKGLTGQINKVTCESFGDLREFVGKYRQASDQLFFEPGKLKAFLAS